MTASSREAAGIVWGSRHLGCTDSQKIRWPERALVQSARSCRWQGEILFNDWCAARPYEWTPPAPLVL